MQGTACPILLSGRMLCCGLIRAANNLAHAADEHVLVEDLISVTKQLVHYYAF
ncbi:MAG: hypothetical protein ABIE47_16625 [Pseudomonadota bacterium]